ncbi:hypothetical protein IWQ60_002458 [Tieghemiomyces parasiticus]|uniref:Uncharacterized protein n=1 Tax=Tieghemiomyces parasiticus TaxID=78921 RepID=A0A9W8E120_9FUNG|nr:hypothetical protein IWQ60_002458 [Tieghemiomyces parasiticus]
MRRTVSTPQGLRATLPDSVTRLMERAPTPVSFSPSPASLLQRLPPSPSLPTFVAVAPSGSAGQAEPPAIVDPPGFTSADPTAPSPPSTPACRTRSRGTVRVAPNSHRIGVRRLSMGATSARAPRRTETRAQRHRDHTRARHEIATLRDEVCRLESTLQSRTREFNEAHDRLRADLEKAHASAAQLRLTVTEQESKVRDLVDESRQLRAHMTAHGLAVPAGLPRRRGQKYTSSTRTDSSSANSNSGGSVNDEEEKGDRSSIGPHTLADYVPASPGPPPIIMPSQIVKAASQAAAVAATPVKLGTITPTKASPAPSTPTALPGPRRRSPKPLADAGVEQRRHLLDALTRLSISTLFTKERLHPNGKLERELADGTLAQAYPDGNVKLVMATEPAKIVLVYANGDTQETYPTTGRMVYWYAKDRIRHVHVGNAPEDEDERGCEELWEFVEAGYTEKRYKDGRKEVIYTRGGPNHKTRTGS